MKLQIEWSFSCDTRNWQKWFRLSAEGYVNISNGSSRLKSQNWSPMQMRRRKNPQSTWSLWYSGKKKGTTYSIFGLKFLCPCIHSIWIINSHTNNGINPLSLKLINIILVSRNMFVWTNSCVCTLTERTKASETIFWIKAKTKAPNLLQTVPFLRTQDASNLSCEIILNFPKQVQQTLRRQPKVHWS